MVRLAGALLAFLLVSTAAAQSTDGDHWIGLKSRRFTPRPEVEPTLRGRLMVAPGQRHHVIVQFSASVTKEEAQKRVAPFGAEILAYLPEHAWFAVTDHRLLAADRGPLGIRWIGSIEPEDKIDPEALRSGPPAHAVEPDGTARYVVVFFADVPQAEATTVLASLGRVISEPDGGTHYLAALATTAVDQLIRTDAVQWIEPEPPPSRDKLDGLRRNMRVDPVQVLGLSGSGVNAGQVESGHPDISTTAQGTSRSTGHDDFLTAAGVTRRVAQGEAPVGFNTSDHANLVAGVLLGNGAASDKCFGPGSCAGGTGAGQPCCVDGDCPGGGTCPGASCGTCQGGTSAGNACYAIAQCPGGTCPVCNGGTAGQWRGVAPRATLSSYSSVPSANVPTKAYGAIPGIALLNASIGPGNCTCNGGTNAGGLCSADAHCPGSFCRTRDTGFDTYTQQSADFDRVVGGKFGAPTKRGLPILYAAGNEAACGLPGGSRWHTINNSGATAKDTVTVGSIDSSSDATSGFSSSGPTEDGRTKPEVVAPGATQPNVGIKGPDGAQAGMSCGMGPDGRSGKCCESPDGYCSADGTSFATPAVSGVTALMIEDWRARYGGDPPPSMVKALLVCGARDLPPPPGGPLPAPATIPGPRFDTGFGAVDANETIRLLRAGTFWMDSITTGTENGRFFTVPARSARVRVVLAWDDPAATANAKPTLCNNLDLELREPIPSSAPRYPWRLDAANPGNSPVRSAGADTINNVEEVEWSDPLAGTWTVKVTGTAVPVDSPQSYSVCVNATPGVPDRGAPFGGDDPGCVPSVENRRNCGAAISTALRKLAAAMAKCQCKHATNAFKGKPFDNTACETLDPVTQKSAKQVFDQAIVKAGANCGADQLAAVAALEALIFGPSSTPGSFEAQKVSIFCDPTSGAQIAPDVWLPPNKDVLKCQCETGKRLAKLSSAVINCHRKMADAFFKGETYDEEACEETGAKSALGKFSAAMGKLDAKNVCTPPCLSRPFRDVLGKEAIVRLDAANVAVYPCPATTTTTSSTTTTTTVPCNCAGARPSRLSFQTVTASGNCGGLSSDTAANFAALACGKLYVGGSAVAVSPPATIGQGETWIAKASCNANTLTLSAALGHEVGQNRCSGGASHLASCAVDADCPGGVCNHMACTATGCFLGAPLPIPNGAHGAAASSTCVVSKLTGNASGTADCAMGSATVGMPLGAAIFLSGDLLAKRCKSGIDLRGGCATNADCGGGETCVDDVGRCKGGTNAGAVCAVDGDCTGGGTCETGACHGGPNDGKGCTSEADCGAGNPCETLIQPCPLCVGAKCSGGPNHGLSCVQGNGTTDGDFPTSQDCPPTPATLAATIALPLSLGTATTTKTAGDQLAQTNVFCGFCADPLGPSFAIPPKPCTVAADCAGDLVFNLCMQRSAGAFTSSDTARTITEVGSPAGALTTGTPAAATLAGIVCLPPTYNATVDAAYDLPGPAAVSIQGSISLQP